MFYYEKIQIQILYFVKNQVTWYVEQISQLMTYTIIHMTRWYTCKNIIKRR